MLSRSVSGLIIVVLVILCWLLWKRGRRSQPLILGKELAQAQGAEKARLSNYKGGPSPLPANLHYDQWLGDFDLIDPAKRPLDDELSALCHRYAGSDAPKRSELRSAASMDDFYTLLTFSRRSAFFAMRDRRPEHIINGLTAIAMIEKKRVDFRDALVAISLLYHSGRAMGSGVNTLIEKAASLAEPQMSELLLGFLKRPEDSRDLRKSWGYTVVETKAGPGFINWGFRSYQPTFPLDQVGLALAQLVKQDKYEPTSVTLASELPPVWFSSVDEDALKKALKSTRGAVSIHADLRPRESPDYQHQTLLIFLAELDDETAAKTLLKLSREKQTRSDYFAAAVSEGRLFCLAIGRCVMSGKASFETQASMQRFSPSMTEVLKTLYPK